MKSLEKWCRGLWVKQSLTLKCLVRVSLSKVSSKNNLSSSYISWVMRVYIVLVKNEKNHTPKSNKQWVSRVTHDLAWVVSHSRKPACQRLFKFHHVLFTWLVSRVISRNLVASIVTKTTSSQILHQTLTHSPYIKSHKNTRKWLNKITIKFDIELKLTKYIVVN